MTNSFAGFNYPKFLANLPSNPLSERLIEFKKNPTRSLRLYGYRQDKPGVNPNGKMFYLDSDFMPQLRWIWADKVEYSHIDHRGWFTDEYGDGDKIRGLVFRLPHNRGFLAGWSMGESMCGEVDYTIYDDEVQAARNADSMAERVAEREQEYQASLCCECGESNDDNKVFQNRNYCDECYKENVLDLDLIA